jgi:tetratricopeptide (TPR) repeat protein
MTKRFGVDLKVSRWLLLIGLMCERLRRFDEAEQILNAIKAYRDDLPHPSASLALCYMSQGKLRQALRELEVVHTDYPDFQMGKVLLGFAQRDAGQLGWQRLLEDVIRDGREEYAVKLAEAALGLELGTSVPAPPSGMPLAEHVPHAQRVYA